MRFVASFRMISSLRALELAIAHGDVREVDLLLDADGKRGIILCEGETDMIAALADYFAGLAEGQSADVKGDAGMAVSGLRKECIVRERVADEIGNMTAFWRNRCLERDEL